MFKRVLVIYGPRGHFGHVTLKVIIRLTHLMGTPYEV